MGVIYFLKPLQKKSRLPVRKTALVFFIGKWHVRYYQPGVCL